MKKILSLFLIFILLAQLFISPLRIYAQVQEEIISTFSSDAPVANEGEKQFSTKELTPFVTTDKPEYYPDETVVINGANFPVNLELSLKVIWPDGEFRDSTGVQGSTNQVKTDANGNFIFSYDLRGEGQEGDYKVQVLMGTEVLSETSFKDCKRPPQPVVCPDGNVKYEVSEARYEYTDGSATVTIYPSSRGSKNSASWQAAEGYEIVGVCLKIGGPGGGSLKNGLTDGGGPFDYDISHVVITTRPIEQTYNPAINIQKSGPVWAEKGEIITFFYEVRNIGDVELSNVNIEDNKCQTVTYESGDDGDGLLELGEVWNFICSSNISWTFPYPYTNEATVEGSWQQIKVSDSDSFALYPFVLRKNVLLYWEGYNIEYDDPQTPFDIQLKKNGQVLATLEISEEDSQNLWLSEGGYKFCEVDLPAGYLPAYECISYQTGEGYPDWTYLNVVTFDLAVEKSAPANAREGDIIIYTYKLTNSGPAAVSPLISDDKCSPINYLSGDDGDGKIEPGEEWLYNCSYQIPEGTAGTKIENRVAVRDEEGEGRPNYWWLGGDRDLSNNSDTAEVEILAKEEPEVRLTLSKSNNLSGEIAVPTTVTFEIRVTNEGGVKLTNVIVKDAQPGGFSYVPNSSKLDGNPITDPTLNSGVLQWTIGDLVAGESKTLSYSVEISQEVVVGTHKNIAVAMGYTQDRYCDLADESFVDALIGVQAACDVVESRQIESNLAESSINIVRSLTYGGNIPAPQVLGAATQLPATGGDTGFTFLAISLGFLGIVLRIGAYIYEKRNHLKLVKKFAKKFAFSFTVLLFLLVFGGREILAVSPRITISSLPEYLTTDSFKISYSALADDPSTIRVRFYVRGEGESYQEFGSELTGSSGWIQVTGNEIRQQKKYYFKAEMTSSNGNASAETSTIYDVSGPSPVQNYKKERVEPSVYKISWKNPGDSDFSRVFIYRGDTPGFEADGSHKIGERGGAADQEMFFEDIGLDAGKEYFYALRAVDKAGNSSSLVGDAPEAIYITETPSYQKEEGTGGLILPKTGETLGEEDKEDSLKEPQEEEVSEVSGGDSDKAMTPLSKLILGVGIIIVAYAGYKLFLSEKPKTKKK